MTVRHAAPRSTVRPARPPRRAATGLLVASALLLTGCGFKGAQSFPLPGGVATGGDAYEVTLTFPDVLDLVEQSSVKVNDVTVGSVSDIELNEAGTEAIVKVRVRNDVTLPANTVASLRQTSLLGEKFVSLDAPPAGMGQGQLKDGAVIENTSRNVEIEEVLGALSLVLNGGGLEQLQVINKEVIAALQGREPEVKDLINQLNLFIGGLDDQKADIVRALDSLDRLTQRLAAQRGIIATALEDLPGGAKVLSDQRENLTQLLTGLDRLGEVSVNVIQASQQNTVADLQALQPILSGLNDAGNSLPNALELLITYPFPETVDPGIRGDFANLFAGVDVSSLIKSLKGEQGLPTLPGLPALPGLPLPQLPLPALPGPGLPTLPLPIPGGGSLPDLPLLRTPLLPTVPGLTAPGGPTLPLLGTGSSSRGTGNSITDILLGGLR